MPEAIIRLTGIRARGHHGVHDWERQQGQDFVVDVRCRVDRGRGGDELAATLDYAALSERVGRAIGGEPVLLIETLAEQLVDLCLEDPRVVEADVTVHKPQLQLPVPVQDVAVSVSGRRA